MCLIGMVIAVAAARAAAEAACSGPSPAAAGGGPAAGLKMVSVGTPWDSAPAVDGGCENSGARTNMVICSLN